MSADPQRPVDAVVDALSTSASMRDSTPDPSSPTVTTQPTAHRGRPCTDAQGRTWRDIDEWWNVTAQPQRLAPATGAESAR